MQPMKLPLFFILTWDNNGRQLTVGHKVNGHLSLYIFTDQTKAEAYRSGLTGAHVLGRSDRSDDWRGFALTLRDSSEFTHVVLDDDASSQMPLDEFISRLPS